MTKTNTGFAALPAGYHSTRAQLARFLYWRPPGRIGDTRRLLSKQKPRYRGAFRSG
jgi:hypothetical protein